MSRDIIFEGEDANARLDNELDIFDAGRDEAELDKHAKGVDLVTHVIRNRFEDEDVAADLELAAAYKAMVERRAKNCGDERRAYKDKRYTFFTG